MTADVAIVPVAWDDPRAEALRREFVAEMDALYHDTPPEFDGFFTTDALEPLGTWLGLVDGAPAGHVALMPLVVPQPDALELRRMVVRPGFRRLGIARRLVDACVAGARATTAERLVLECGDRQPAAAALYASSGFARIENYPPFDRKPEQLCFGMRLR
ncbi:MAG: GNAT family N-acetyltransferase [Microbacteriaceae bacterium]|nr:GNAT family N-acetyltransferase [Microbacteriaceae bacterium]